MSLPPWRSVEDAELAAFDMAVRGTAFVEIVDGKRVRVDPSTVEPYDGSVPLRRNHWPTFMPPVSD